MSGINYLINGITTYPITHSILNVESQIINHLLKSNGYKHLKTNDLIQKKEKRVQKENINQTHRKWANFTYVGNETKFITKLFREYNIGIAYRTNNTIENLLNRENKMYNKFDQCGIYEFKCNTCPKVYIGQTGRNFKTRFKEHIQDIRNNRTKTGYSQYIINTGHEYGNIENTLNILNVEKKGPFLNTLEKFHIYKKQKTDNLLNESCTDTYNPIFEFLL
jgi:hypothetical protein